MTTEIEDVLSRLTARLGIGASGRGAEVLSLLTRRMTTYGETPVVDFRVCVAGKVRNIALKLEGVSPWRSIKGRTAIGLVASVIPWIEEGSRLVESTSGNLGVALAGLAKDLNLPFTAVVDDRLPAAMGLHMRTAGAELVLAHGVNGDNGLVRRLATLRRICSADSSTVWTNQYENALNPLIHQIWTGPELLAQTPDIQALFIGVSTGGTLSGVSRAVRALRNDLKVVGVDVEGSRALGGPAGPRILTGIGAGHPSHHLDGAAYDAFEVVSSWSGALQCREWRRQTGLSLGGSSGAVLAAALRYLTVHPELTRVLCLCPDLGENYADTIYDDDWARKQGLTMADGRTSVDMVSQVYHVQGDAPDMGRD